MKKDAPQLDRFADEHCLDFITKAISRYVENNYDKLECNTRLQPESASLDDIRLEFTTNVKTYDNQIGFDAIVSADVEICETVRGYDKSDLVTQWFRVPCQIIFEEKIERFRINDGKGGGIEIYSCGAKNQSQFATTNELVPVIYSENYDEEATRFLKKHCPEALETPMPVPIEEIAEAMGIPPINYKKHLSSDFSIFGRICFTEEEIDVYNQAGMPETITAKRGQIFIDNDTYLLCNVGCLRNTIAHELFHWTRHRLYATIKRLLDTPNYKSTKCRIRPQGASKRKDEPLTDEEWMELQANSISPRIIMPKQTAKPKAIEILKKHKYNLKTADEQILRNAIAELAGFFQVSKQLATVRLAQLGITQAQEIFDADYDSNISCSTQIQHSDILSEYSDNSDFRNAINSGLFRYAEGRFVINDPKYINRVVGGIYILTDYARQNLTECSLRFETIEAVIDDIQGDGLYRRNKSGFALAKKYIHNATTTENAETLAKANQAFIEEAERHRIYLKAVGSGTYFSESFNALMKAYFEPLGIKEHKYGAEIFDKTGISDKLYRDMRNGNQTYCPSHKNIVAICAGFDFSIEIAEKLLEKGGKSFLNTNEHIALKAILTAYRGQDIYTKDAVLRVMGYGGLFDD